MSRRSLGLGPTVLTALALLMIPAGGHHFGFASPPHAGSEPLQRASAAVCSDGAGVTLPWLSPAFALAPRHTLGLRGGDSKSSRSNQQVRRSSDHLTGAGEKRGAESKFDTQGGGIRENGAGSARAFPVLVRGLGETDRADVSDLFSDCGGVLGVRAARDRSIVYFDNRRSAQLAARLNGTEFEGGLVRCSVLPAEDAAAARKQFTRDQAPLQFPVVINGVPSEVTTEEVSSPPTAAAPSANGLVFAHMLLRQL
jgi:hypothetical protein